MRLGSVLPTALAFAALLALGALGLRGWLGTGSPRGDDAASATDTSGDEQPLEVGILEEGAAHRAQMRLYPWFALQARGSYLREVLPPDPERPTGKEREDRITNLLMQAKVRPPATRMEWPQVLQTAKAALEPKGIPVFTHEPMPDVSLPVVFEDRTYGALEFLGTAMQASQHGIAGRVTERGFCMSSDLGVSLALREIRLARARRSVEPEHADPALEAPWRPNLVEAPIDEAALDMKSQTGVDVVPEVSFHENSRYVTWRGDPRPLRRALDAMCEKLGAFWRYDDKKVYVLAPW